MWSELWPAPRLVMYLGLCGYGVLRYLYHANRGKQATLGAALIGSSGVQVTVWPSVRSTTPPKSKNVKRVSLQRDPFYNHMEGNRNCLGSLADLYLPVLRSALWSFRIFRYNITHKLCQQYHFFISLYQHSSSEKWKSWLLRRILISRSLAFHVHFWTTLNMK